MLQKLIHSSNITINKCIESDDRKQSFFLSSAFNISHSKEPVGFASRLFLRSTTINDAPMVPTLANLFSRDVGALSSLNYREICRVFFLPKVQEPFIGSWRLEISNSPWHFSKMYLVCVSWGDHDFFHVLTFFMTSYSAWHSPSPHFGCFLLHSSM